MNERIRQLADEAEAQYCDLGDASCFKRLGLVEAVVFKPEDLEKFAQLIVQECIDLISPYTVSMNRPGEEYLHPILEIRKHFGVKQ
jgi:enoyl-CoA hydratase/carnithine racemase